MDWIMCLALECGGLISPVLQNISSGEDDIGTGGEQEIFCQYCVRGPEMGDLYGSQVATIGLLGPATGGLDRVAG